MQDDHRHIPVEIKLPAKYAKGGLATAAKDVASAGEGGDTMLVHVNKAEFEMLRKQWGDPQINDKTGLPSYSWGDWLGPLAGVIGGVTGIGGDVGGAISGALGADLSPAVSSALGSALIGGGIGALGGGGKGALYGGLAGGATGYLSGGDNMLSGLFGGGASAMNPLAASGAIGPVEGPTTSGATLDAVGKAGGASNGLGALLSGNSKYGYAPLLMAGLVAANAFGQNRKPSADSQAAAAQTAAAQAKFNQSLPVVNFQRTLNPLQGDPRKYGFGPTQNRFTNNGLGYADGGEVKGYAMGGMAQPSPLASMARPMPQGMARPMLPRPMGQPMPRPMMPTPSQVMPQMRPPLPPHPVTPVGPNPGWGMQPPPPPPIVAPPPTSIDTPPAPIGPNPSWGNPPPPPPVISQPDSQPPMGLPPVGQVPNPSGRPTLFSSFGPSGGGLDGRGGLGSRYALAKGGSVPPLGGLRAAQGLPNQQRLVQGPGSGRSDDIPARLSDSEYIIDAESVGMLGDGSAKAGAAKLDAMRANLRKHKGGALAQGKISPNAKSPEQYMNGGRK